MNPSSIPHGDHDTRWVALVACCASLTSLLRYFRAGDILLYGDAVAHINIARRVFDSRTPGLLQLGTVWLPLPHILTMPFIFNRAMWETGVGGSIPSMIAYVFAVVGVFRLARRVARNADFSPAVDRGIAWTAAALFGLNPNLLYMQATAMTEALYLALFVWAVAHFLEFFGEGETAVREMPDSTPRSLWKCGACVAGACLTRYDGWFLAAVLCMWMAWLWLRSGAKAHSLPALAKFVLLAAGVLVLWLAYNSIVYRNPIEFANGPYSARAIERKTFTLGAPPHPGTGNPALATAYFVKSGASNVAEGRMQFAWLLLALAGSIAAWLSGRRNSAALLLWVPVPFYALSVAYGSVPIFTPDWWPYSAYNVRYGLQLLPAFAVFVPFVLAWIVRRSHLASVRGACVLTSAVLLIASYALVWRATPVCYREAWINSRTRIALESQLARQLRRLPPESSFLMYLGSHVGALQQAGIPLARSVNEGNHRPHCRLRPAHGHHLSCSVKPFRAWGAWTTPRIY